MDDSLTTIIAKRQAMAQAYLLISAKYNIPIDFFGEKIDFMEQAVAKGDNHERIVRRQLLEYLYIKRSTKNQTLGWEEVYGRQPDMKLRCAVGLEILLDTITHPQTNPDVTWSLISDIHLALKNTRNREGILKNWGIKVAKEITKGPYPRGILKEIEQFATKPKPNPQSLWNDSEGLINKIKNWHETNIQTLEKRVNYMRETYKNFSPNNWRWQKIFLDSLHKNKQAPAQNIGDWDKERSSESLNSWADMILKEFCKKDSKNFSKPSNALLEEKIGNIVPNYTLIGLQHGNSKNVEAIYRIIERLKLLNYNILTLEEPNDTSWKPYIEFAQSLGKKKDWSPKELFEQAIKHCKQRGITSKSSPEKLSIIYLAKKIGLEVVFIDIAHEDKLTQFKERTNRYLQNVVDSPKPTASDPITAVGGEDAWLANIKDSYRACLERSIHMVKEIIRIGPIGGVCHIGGNLHLMDMKHYMSGTCEAEINAISLKNKRNPTPISKAMGKEIESDFLKKNFCIDIYRKLDQELSTFFSTVESWKQPMATEAKKPPKPAKLKKGVSQVLANTIG